MTSYAPLAQHTPQTVTLPITQKLDWARQASAKWAVKAWRVFCHWSTTGKRLTVSTEQCSGSSGGKKALWLGSKDRSLCQHSCPAGVSFRAVPNVKAMTNLSLRQPGTQGHKGVNPACRGEGLSSVLTELNTSWYVLIDLHVLKWFNWLVYLDRKLTSSLYLWVSFAITLWFLEGFPTAHSLYLSHTELVVYPYMDVYTYYPTMEKVRQNSNPLKFWSM